MGNWMNPVDTTPAIYSYLTHKEAEKTAKASKESADLLRAQLRDERLRQVGMVAEGTWITVKWDGEWLSSRLSAAAPRLLRAAAKRLETQVHLDNLVTVVNKVPSITREGNLDVTKRDGDVVSFPYPRSAASHFEDLADQLSAAIRSRTPGEDAAQPPPPMPPAGWHPAPNHEGWLRYWDGSSWTEHFHDLGQRPSV